MIVTSNSLGLHIVSHTWCCSFSSRYFTPRWTYHMRHTVFGDDSLLGQVSAVHCKLLVEDCLDKDQHFNSRHGGRGHDAGFDPQATRASVFT